MAIYRAGLWSRANFPASGLPLATIARRIPEMRLSGPRRTLQGLMSEIRGGRWTSMATICVDHRRSERAAGSPIDRMVTARRVAPNRYVLDFS